LVKIKKKTIRTSRKSDNQISTKHVS